MAPAAAPAAPAAAPPRRRRRRAAVAKLGARVQRTAAGALARPLTWVLFVGFMFAVPLTKTFGRELPPPPPVLGTVPAFALTNEHGEARQEQHLRGRVWIGEFMTLDQHERDHHRAQLLGEIQHRMRNMGGSAKILSISVAPASDTPLRLLAYATQQHANPYVWNFCTGETAALHDALSRLLREQHDDLLPGAMLADTGYFVLVDADLRVRGFYPPTPAGLDALIFNCGLVANLYRPAAQPEGSIS